MTQPWFRFYSEALRDRKLEYACRITGQPKVIIIGMWTTLLALANDSPDRGALLIAEGFPVTIADIVRDTELAEDIVVTILDAFQRLGMAAQLDGTMLVCNWDKRQFASDDVTSRVQKLRAKQKAEAARNGTETLQERRGQQDRNAPDTDTEQNKADHSIAERAPEAGDTPPASPSLPSGIPDPFILTVKAIAALDLSKNQWRHLGAAERRGKDRDGVRNLVKRKLNTPPPAIAIFREVTNYNPKRVLCPSIVEAVGDLPDDLDFWREVIIGYIGNGWNPQNVNGMLGFYRAREIPGPGLVGGKGTKDGKSRVDSNLAAAQAWRSEA